MTREIKKQEADEDEERIAVAMPRQRTLQSLKNKSDWVSAPWQPLDSFFAVARSCEMIKQKEGKGGIFICDAESERTMP
jgi:hypothetical protein